MYQQGSYTLTAKRSSHVTRAAPSSTPSPVLHLPYRSAPQTSHEYPSFYVQRNSLFFSTLFSPARLNMVQTMAMSLSAIANAGVLSIQKRAALPQSSCMPSLSRCNVVRRSMTRNRRIFKSRSGIVCASIRRSECVEESQLASPEPASSETDGSFFLERALLFSAAMLTPMVTEVGVSRCSHSMMLLCMQTERSLLPAL